MSMNSRLTYPMDWSRYFLWTVCVLLLWLVSFQPAFSASTPEGTIEITDGKEHFMSTLASMPYTSSGTGSVLYVLECSSCPSSQAFEKDWKSHLNGVEIRRFLIATNASTANEAAYLARTRDINDFYAFMNHSKVAPKIKACNCPADNVAIRAFNSVMEPLGKVLTPTMKKNGWSKSPHPPQFIWETNGRVYVSAYSKDGFQEILTALGSGTQVKEASASPPHATAHDSEPTRNESSPADTAALSHAPRSDDHPATQGSAPSAPTSKNDSASTLNVAGIQLGMTVPEVLAALQAFDPTLKIEDHHSDGVIAVEHFPKWGISARGEAETFDIILSSPGSPRQSVIAFTRISTFSSKPVSKTQVLDALRSRYGNEVTPYPTGNKWFKLWFFGPDGKPSPPPAAANNKKDFCVGVRGGYWEAFSRVLYEYDFLLNQGRPFEKINPKCGAVLQLEIGSTQNPELTGSLRFYVIDNSAYYQALDEARAYLRNQQENREKQEVEKAKKESLPRL